MAQTPDPTQLSSPTGMPRLRRVLTLWDLVFYGIILVMPIAPIPLFGIAQKLSRGHFVSTILVAMVAMMLTAVSYGRMAARYPAAGSAYTYVGRGLNPHLGFLTGWAMVLDYLIQPLFNGILGALTIQRFFPEIPYPVLAALFIGFMTFLNLRGIRTTARASLVLMAFMCTVIGAFVLLALRYLFHTAGWHGIFSLEPFYNPRTFDLRTMWTGTSFAALTYIGFDGVTTLAEDVENPRQNIMRAILLVCLFTGIAGGLQVYLGQRVWPDYATFPQLETAFMDVTRRVGGQTLFQALGVVLILSCVGAGLTGQVGVARLLFGMGRDNVIPRGFFAYLDPKRNTPTRNIWLIGIVAYIGAMLISYEQAGEILNFGAFLAFMGVNLATFWQFAVLRQPGRRRRWFVDIVMPLSGFLFCLWIWLGLKTPAKVVGGLWLLAGLAYGAFKTRGFQAAPAMIDFTEL
ncbi:MAG TPA: APC family permease [Terriglobia bacterium]|nr:APC family permease [Terriglobia bacterium]